MKDIRYLLLQSQGTPLATLIQKGLVSDWARSLISNRATKISVHYDRAAHRALKQAGSHACCLGDKIFLGPAIGTSTGPRFSEVLHHELVHTAQIERSRRTGGGSSLQQIEEEAIRLAAGPTALYQIVHGANPDEVYYFWWLLAIAAAAYVMLRPNVANAPGPGDKTYPSVSEAQVAGEAVALFAVPEASIGIAGRLGLGFYGSMAVAGATSTMSFRGVGDLGRGEFSGVQTYLIDGATGAVIGVVVPGGIKLIGEGATRSLDWLATQGMRSADFAIAKTLSQRAAKSPVTADELRELFRSRNVTGKAADWWLNRRGLIVLYRGQGVRTANILSPIARTDGLAASEELVARMRASGMSNSEIARITGFWSDQPVPGQVYPGFDGEPLGGVGIPTTRLPSVAANYGEKGVVYIIRMPKGSAIHVPPWGLSVEHEYVILNQIPREAVVGTVPLHKIPPLMVNDLGQLAPRLNWSGSAAADAAVGDTSGFTFPREWLHPALTSPRLPAVGVPPLVPAPDKSSGTVAKRPLPPDPPGAGTTTDQTVCWRPNSDYINPVCTTYKTYVVKRGDTLWDLAKKFYGDPKRYPKIYQANRGILGADQDRPRLLPGQQLTIPDSQ
jgi:uncharacterized protein DUF4157/LysM domain-containing protein